ncbi:hypothetical protein [Thermococcus sp. 21S7]|uniref:hypothetical protein n=1 Tax=Thermococcus sp. 21S7 TaxID=1638221 RepID=UPI00143BBD78|nr:hypothetical protein [Thermococcus sp. 21S7]NJE60185.1 hypothetical protein [Thermococcus sp. 21S7]
MDWEVYHLVPRSGVLIGDTPVGEDEEKALLTVEAYRMSFEGSLKKRKLVTLVGASIAGMGAVAFWQTANPLLGAGLLGLGVGTAVLAQLMIKPHPIKLLSKVHIPTLLVPYNGGSLALVPAYFSERNVPGVVVKHMTFYEADVTTSLKISEELPATHDSLKAEITLREEVSNIADLLTPKSEIGFNVVAFDRDWVEPVLATVLEVSSIDKQPTRSLAFSEKEIEKSIFTVKRLEELGERAEIELEVLEDIEKNVNVRVNVFVNGLTAMLDRVTRYFSEIRKLLKRSLFGGVNIYAKPTKEELENYGYAYVQHKYHVRLHSKYPTTSLIAIFQRHIDHAEEKIRSRVSEYVINMKREVRYAKEETRQRMEATREKYKERIGRKRERLRRLNNKVKTQQRELAAINDQIQSLIEQAEQYESEAYEYESRAELAETASERRSYLSRANKARKEADKLRNRATRLYERSRRIKAEHEVTVEKVEELEMEIEELKKEMEMKLKELKLRGEKRIREIQEHYAELIRMVREDLDRFIHVRDEHLEIVDAFYDSIIESEANYQKAPIEYRLEALQKTHSNLLGALDALRKGHRQFIMAARALRLGFSVERPTMVYIPVWVIVSERGEERLIPAAVVNESRRGELLIPHPSIKTALEGLIKSLRPDILREAEKDNPNRIIAEGLKNLGKLVEMGLLTEKEAVRIKKMLGG